MNQYRDRSKPTWVFGFEARFGVCEPMHACNPGLAGGARAVRLRLRRESQRHRGRRRSGHRRRQLQRGVRPASSAGRPVSSSLVHFETHQVHRALCRVSPLFEFPRSKSDFGATDLQGSLVNHPPLQGWVYAGMQVIPFEQRE